MKFIVAIILALILLCCACCAISYKVNRLRFPNAPAWSAIW